MRGKPKSRIRGSRLKGLTAQGYRDGLRWRKNQAGQGAHAAASAAHHAWSKAAAQRRGGGKRWPVLLRNGRRYMAGFRRGAGVKFRMLPVPLRGSAAAVVYAVPDAEANRSLLGTLRQLPLTETIVVLPGDCTAPLLAASQSQHGVTTVYRPGLANPDIGRALGGKLARTDIVLFLDGSNRMTPSRLARFLWRCDNGMDVALCDASGHIGRFHLRSAFYQLAEFLNRTLNRRDLRASSLSVPPYAMSRRALQAIGPGLLSIPPHAQAAAILGGMRVGIAAAAAGTRKPNPELGGYASAWRTAASSRGSRQSFPDTVRNRAFLEGWP